MSNIHKTRVGVIAFTTAFMLLSGCSQIIKTGANIALRFSENHIIPPILSMDDTDTACVSSNALTPVIVATQAMGADPTRMAVLLYLGSAMCSEQASLEQELGYLRNARSGNIEAAQDARIAQKRLAETASRRQYAAYQIFAQNYERDYRVKLGDQCPRMKKDLDKLVFFLGMLSGLQAVVNDVASGGAVNVPKDIAAIVERGMGCLDNQQFWGAPQAVRAAVWTLLPGAGDGKPDPYQTMKDATRIGEATGVRLPHAVYAMAAQASGRDDLIRDALKTYGKTLDSTAVNAKFRLPDAIGSQMVRNISDRYWTEKTGSRTPDGGMLKFWDEESKSDISINIDDVLAP